VLPGLETVDERSQRLVQAIDAPVCAHLRALVPHPVRALDEYLDKQDSDREGHE
jgi:hypothetical protein